MLHKDKEVLKRNIIIVNVFAPSNRGTKLLGAKTERVARGNK